MDAAAKKTAAILPALHELKTLISVDIDTETKEYYAAFSYCRAVPPFRLKLTSESVWACIIAKEGNTRSNHHLQLLDMYRLK
jgi:hypothetical protein